MWTCPKCHRIFKNTNQPHTCKSVPPDKHFETKPKAKQLFDLLLRKIGDNVGKFNIISLPCCVHLYGTYDFLAALPKTDRLEIRFALDRKIDSPRLKVCVPMSAKTFKNCFDISTPSQLDHELINWIRQSYLLKN